MNVEAVFKLENAGWPALLVDGSGAILRTNSAAVRFFGPALEVAGTTLGSLWSSENGSTAEQFLQRWEQSPLPLASLKFRTCSHPSALCQMLVCIIAEEGPRRYLLQFLPDNNPEVRQNAGELSLAQKQKLDCALQLARTVALDFNNALTTILGHTSLLLSKMEPTHPWRNSLLQVEKSAARAAEIATDLGTFSRQDKEARVQASGNLNLLVQRSVEFFQRNGTQDQPAWGMQLERNLFAAKFDEAKMQQVFIKVIENALQSLAANGRITLQTRNIELTQPTQDRNVQLVTGAYVCVEISDNGAGIAPEVLPRIFEPFFTTRAGHRGLGLAWVYGIVTNHGGGVAVSSQAGAGTSVRIYLPAEKRIVRDSQLPAGDLTGTQTLLVVDDEDLCLNMCQTILVAYGYQVLIANSGQKALEILSSGGKHVDLLITDLVMPAMSGRELIEHMRVLTPGLRVLCTSGYVWAANQEPDMPYLRKPFTSQELLAKVKQALES